MARDDSRRVEHLEREIAEARAQMSHTVDVLREKVSPQRLRARAMARIRPGGSWTNTVTESFRSNPLLYSLLGSAIAWRLLAARSARPSTTNQPDYARLRELWESAYWRGRQDAVSSTRRAQLRDVGERARESGAELGGQLQRGIQQLRSRWRHTRPTAQLQERLHEFGEAWQQRGSSGSSMPALLGLIVGMAYQALGGRKMQRAAHRAVSRRRAEYPSVTEADVAMQDPFFPSDRLQARTPPSPGLEDPTPPTERR